MTILGIESKPNKVYEQQRAELVATAAGKPMIHVHHFECVLQSHDVDYADKEGDALIDGTTQELVDSGETAVRVHIPVGVSRKVAVRALRKILGRVKVDPTCFTLLSDTPENSSPEPMTAEKYADVTLKAALKVVAERRRKLRSLADLNFLRS
jgi:hypothetical protein